MTSPDPFALKGSCGAVSYTHLDVYKRQELNPEPVTGDDEWSEKIELLVRRPVPVVSLTFGLAPREHLAALQRAGSLVLATVTSPEEARSAAALGVDGLTVQGYRAGGHSAVHDLSLIHI